VIAVNRILAYVFIVIGVVLLVETAVLGGGEVGFLAGAVFIVLGLLRRRAIRPPGSRV
jgi:hypothetical protein